MVLNLPKRLEEFSSIPPVTLSRGSEVTIMSYVITGTNSAGVLSLKRDSAVAAIEKAVELMGDGTRDVHITDPDDRIYIDAEFSQLYMAART
jgi:hypothetical protein